MNAMVFFKNCYSAGNKYFKNFPKPVIIRSNLKNCELSFPGFTPVKNGNKISYIVHLLLSKSRRPTLLLWTAPLWSSSTQTADSKVSAHQKPIAASQKRAIKIAIQDADKLFDSNLYEEAVLTLTPYKESGDVEVLWRLSRAQYKVAELPSVSDSERRQLILDAYTNISQAMEVDDTHWAVHKWMSVLLDERSAYDGIKARISQLDRVKYHMLRAAELNPKDATTLHMLGSWCYQIADMPWFQRKIAATIFAAPPNSTFEEALEFFSQAEDVEPRFYSRNLLMLGKTLLKLKRQNEAIPYLVEARDFNCSSGEDAQVKREAEEILKNLNLDDIKK